MLLIETLTTKCEGENLNNPCFLRKQGCTIPILEGNGKSSGVEGNL